MSATATANADLGGSRKKTIEIAASPMTAAVSKVSSSLRGAPPMPGASRKIAATAAAGQNQVSSRGHRNGDRRQSHWLSGFQTSCDNGRQNTASTVRIGYSATQENTYGAINPENKPPIMPP